MKKVNLDGNAALSLRRSCTELGTGFLPDESGNRGDGGREVRTRDGSLRHGALRSSWGRLGGMVLGAAMIPLMISDCCDAEG
jgi:hypothetical protein